MFWAGLHREHKPWGTGQAVLVAKEVIHKPFAVINVDDYYSKEAFRQNYDWMILDHADTAVVMAGDILKNTLSEQGSVTIRVVYRMDEGRTHIRDVVETGSIIKTENGVEADGISLDPGSYVFMNFWRSR